jgi:hypothetical protein
MAKKQIKKTSEANNAANLLMETSIEIPSTVVESSKKTKNSSWEIKDRVYILSNGSSPLSYKIKTSGIYWFDEEKGYERELLNTSNQKTCFVDEMVGDKRLEHVIFRNGTLTVPKNKQVLQKLLSLYHPHKDKLYYEFDPVSIAVDEVESLELEIKALMAAQSMDIDMAEAVLRVELGSKVSSMSSKELKRDLLLFAKRNPSLFLELANDENVHLRNIGVRATEMGIIRLSKDNRSFSWASNDRKLMTVPFDEHPYSALAAWFKTDEGMEVFGSIEKRLK